MIKTGQEGTGDEEQRQMRQSGRRNTGRTNEIIG